jgi:hypothetical protein
MINTNLVNDIAQSFKKARYDECSYYMADTTLAAAALEWAVERLQGYLARCLNTSEGYCDIWYLESHSSCKILMDILYEFTQDEIYNPKVKLDNSLWD